MALQPGDHIRYRLLPETTAFGAIIQTIDENVIVLRLDPDAPSHIPVGQDIVIPEPDAETDYYNEVIGRDKTTLRLKRLWTGSRDYFRVNDAFPVLYKKVEGNENGRESRVIPGFGVETNDLEAPDETISPWLRKMLLDINARLGLVLTKLNLESEGLSRSESIPVNISAAGLRFTMDGQVQVGDTIEVKMLLPASPPVGIVTYGSVTRVEKLGVGGFDVSVSFLDMDDEVRDIIIQYALKRQRKFIRRQRQRGANT